MNLGWVTILMNHVVIFPLSTLKSKLIYTLWGFSVTRLVKINSTDINYESIVYHITHWQKDTSKKSDPLEESINKELNNNGPQVDVSLPMEDTEGYFSNLHREITRTESDFSILYREIARTESVANQEVIRCYYRFGKALSERRVHYERTYQPRAMAQILVNMEARKQLPNVTKAEFKKIRTLSQKVYKLFSIGEELISRVSFTVSDISTLSWKKIESIIKKHLENRSGNVIIIVDIDPIGGLNWPINVKCDGRDQETDFIATSKSSAESK
ncbi:1103_t:CDS:1 [Funneliformis mosseae]|uniref:1103_t:CDS:1 n=1 Tax=Funneliformis mosseae TaxID=27381 RepID=A0A9N9BPC1_FUNMO|nr:1103_t:CDS:1 [Funneliformis mosseae]